MERNVEALSGYLLAGNHPVGMCCAARNRDERRWDPNGRGVRRAVSVQHVGGQGASTRWARLVLNAGPSRGRAHSRLDSYPRTGTSRSPESVTRVGGGRSSSRRWLTDRSGSQTTRATPVGKRAKCGRPGQTDQNNASRNGKQERAKIRTKWKLTVTGQRRLVLVLVRDDGRPPG